MKKFLNTSDVLTICSMQKDKLTIIKEYGENIYRDDESNYPVDAKKLIRIAKDWHLYNESTAFTYKGHIYVKVKHCINGYDCLVTWLRSSKSIYTAHNIRMKIREIFGI